MGFAMTALKYILICIFILQVNSMALHGPALTRYDPCGLGIIYFDQITDVYWRGVVNFGLYGTFQETVIEINFDKQVVIYGASMNTSVTVQRNNSQDFIISPRGPVPKQYVFYIQVHRNHSDSLVPTVNKFALNNVTLCNTEIKATHTISSLNKSKSDNMNYAHACGRRSMEHTELVSVRTIARAGDWPWHVAIFDGVTYKCGGSIISRTAIVTAGHCVYFDGSLVEANRISIVAGTDNYKELNQIGRQTLKATNIILHPGHIDKTSTCDLAIIKVNKLKYTEFVQPICIWGPVYDKTNLFGHEAVVVGFGDTENNTLSDTLRVTYTVVQNDAVCLAFRPPVYRNLINEFTFCAGFGPQAGINPRNGDSGGGLVVSTMQPDHMISWFLRGVLSRCGTSNGSSKCDPNYYVVYTDVGPHYGWIYHHSGLIFKDNIL